MSKELRESERIIHLENLKLEREWNDHFQNKIVPLLDLESSEPFSDLYMLNQKGIALYPNLEGKYISTSQIRNALSQLGCEVDVLGIADDTERKKKEKIEQDKFKTRHHAV